MQRCTNEMGGAEPSNRKQTGGIRSFDPDGISAPNLVGGVSTPVQQVAARFDRIPTANLATEGKGHVRGIARTQRSQSWNGIGINEGQQDGRAFGDTSGIAGDD